MVACPNKTLLISFFFLLTLIMKSLSKVFFSFLKIWLDSWNIFHLVEKLGTLRLNREWNFVESVLLPPFFLPPPPLWSISPLPLHLLLWWLLFPHLAPPRYLPHTSCNSCSHTVCCITSGETICSLSHNLCEIHIHDSSDAVSSFTEYALLSD